MGRSHKLWDPVDLESEEEILNLEEALESALQIIPQVLWRHTRVLEPRKGNGGERAAAEMGKGVKIGQEEVGDTISSLMCRQGRGGLGSILQQASISVPKGTSMNSMAFVYFCLSIKGGWGRITAERRTDTKKNFLIV